MTDADIDAAELRRSIGRRDRRHQVFDADTAARMAALLDWETPPPAGGDLPPLWHWSYFTPLTRAGDLAKDGHAVKGAFLPDVPLPHRLFAGARIHFHAPIRIGDAVERQSTVHDVRVKEGRTGPLVFVVLHHELSVGSQVVLQEEQDIVYRGAAPEPAPGALPGAAPPRAQFSREVAPDPVLLFRYSAVTFNAHRIHYDRDYAVGQAGYPGLVVHAPLTATLLADLLRMHRPDARLTSAQFRALRPICDTAPFTICGHCAGDTAILWAQAPAGGVALRLDARVQVAAA